MPSYRLTLQYKGTGYFGWQIQTGAKERTIQSELNRCLQIIAKSKDIKSIGSGRTDAGVHAIGQVVKVEIPLDIPSIALMKGLNSLLSDSIRVLDASECDDNFHPIFHAKSKEYLYCFSCGDGAPFNRELVTSFKYDLDLDQMKKACQLFIGEHDFRDFYCTGTPVAHTRRIIFECSLDVVRPTGITSTGMDEYYQFSVVGSGFMKQMVRLMVGTLWNIGRNKVTLDDLKESLAGNGKGKLGAVAPPEGLYLKEVNY